MLGPVEAVYDRAALVALPAEIRQRYAAHLMEITATAPQLLIGYEYDQALQAGPPFSVGREELHRHYGESYRLTLLASADVAGGLKGKCPAKEIVWLLSTR
jgi:thiopurine S-methyltransferase